MSDMTQVQPIKKKRAFRQKWNEISACYDEAATQLHSLGSSGGAQPHVERLRALLDSVPGVDQAILGESARALIAEFEGNWVTAARHRNQEVQLILRLYQSLASVPDPEVREFALQGRHKPQVLSELAAAKNFYQTHAGQDSVQALQKAIDLLGNSSEPV